MNFPDWIAGKMWIKILWTPWGEGQRKTQTSFLFLPAEKGPISGLEAKQTGTEEAS